MLLEWHPPLEARGRRPGDCGGDGGDGGEGGEGGGEGGDGGVGGDGEGGGGEGEGSGDGGGGGGVNMQMPGRCTARTRSTSQSCWHRRRRGFRAARRCSLAATENLREHEPM